MTPADCPPAVKPLPPHGTYARANGRPKGGVPPCHCNLCTPVGLAYRKRRRVAAELGKPLNADVTEVLPHLRKLLAADDNVKQLAARLGFSHGSLKKILAGKTRSIRRDRVETILAARPAAAGGTVIEAIGTSRRVQALIAAGHALKVIAADSGLSCDTLAELISGRHMRVRRETAEAIDATYRRLSGTQGASARSRSRAAREGWPTPEQWDGEIDRPDADPNRWLLSECARVPAEALVEDAEWLHDEHGLSWEAAAAQVGVLVNTLHTYRGRVRERAAAQAAS
jgi:transcriptional regulator with XRE-family HTH domain